LSSLQNKVLDISNPDFMEKILFFDTIDSNRKGSTYLEFLEINNLVVDILMATDLNSPELFNSVVLYSRIERILVNLENQTVKSFAKVFDYTGEMMGLKKLENIRPMFRPLTKKFVTQFSQRHNLNQENYNNLKRLRRLIVKEYFRLYYWKMMTDKYESFESVNVLRFVEFEYKSSSLIYQLYYGET
jgi:hypothetical protein